MELKAYLDQLPHGGITRFASEVGISAIYLSQLSARQDERVPSAELCVLIERASKREVMRWDLRPTDWHRIWPELLRMKGAPSIAQEAV